MTDDLHDDLLSTPAHVYLAARYSRREELLAYANVLRDAGHTITSRWVGGSHQIGEEELVYDDALARRFGQEDIDDLCGADLVISFTEPPRTTSSRGGRHVEFGYALAHGIPCWIVGPRENVFHVFADRIFDSWDDLAAEVELAKEDNDNV